MPPKRITILNFTLVLIQTYDQFDQIQPNRQNNHVPRNHNPSLCQSKKSCISDEDIIIPRCGKVSIQEQIPVNKQKLIISKKISGYKRLSFKQNLPNPFEYQLTDQDLKAIQIIKKYHQANTDQQLNFQEQQIVNFIKVCEDFQHSNMQQKRKIVNNQNLMASCFINLLHKQKSQILKGKLQNILCNIFRFWKLTKKQMNIFSLLRTYWPRQETANHIYNLSIPFKIRRPHILQHHNKFSFQKFNMGIYKKGRKLRQNQNENVINSLSQWCQLWQKYRRLRKNFVKYTKKFHSMAFKSGYERPLHYKEVISKQFMNYQFQYMKKQQQNKKVQQFSNYFSISNSTSDSIEAINNSNNQNKSLEQENEKITRLTHDLQEQETLNQPEEYSILGSSQSTIYDKVIQIPSDKQMSLDQVFKKFSYKRIKRI